MEFTKINIMNGILSMLSDTSLDFMTLIHIKGIIRQKSN